ncbi:hypothetical protein FACS189491_00750 [Spirochaetia bacterium]|nr:hypothetical protein FACS189491_00750 [Spirochaetia bacterium]
MGYRQIWYNVANYMGIKLYRSWVSTIILLAVSCNPQNYDDENDFIAAIYGKTIEITGYKGTNTNVNIPPRIGKLPVTAIGPRAFLSSSLGSKKLFTGVKIPKGVTHIGEEAFFWNELSEIIIPDTVVSIGDDAFAHNKITRVVIPESVRYIGIRGKCLNFLLTPKLIIYNS